MSHVVVGDPHPPSVAVGIASVSAATAATPVEVGFVTPLVSPRFSSGRLLLAGSARAPVCAAGPWIPCPLLRLGVSAGPKGSASLIEPVAVLNSGSDIVRGCVSGSPPTVFSFQQLRNLSKGPLQVASRRRGWCLLPRSLLPRQRLNERRNGGNLRQLEEFTQHRRVPELVFLRWPAPPPPPPLPAPVWDR